ncbi:MAG: hypothetical protein H3Z52_10965 [archaeon]|nr:hypothetical protein [archaeon]MCP8321441.1 hypothetical protein [archaeon]
MIKSRLEADPILKYLFERSSFTQAQLDTYLIDRTIANEKVELKEKIAMRDRKNVSKGAFIHTLRQAQGNLKRAIYTLILSEYLGLLGDESMVKLLQVSNLLKGAEGAILDEKLSEVIEVTETIIETLSGKKKT